MWTGSRLGMILHREDRQRPVPEAFDGAVVEVDMRHRQLGRPCHRLGISLDRKPMILRRDQDLAGRQFLEG